MAGGAMAARLIARRTGTTAVARQEPRALADFLDLHPGIVEGVYSRSAQMPANASLQDQIRSLYWMTGLGFVLRSSADVNRIINSSVRSVPDWYSHSNAALSLGQPFAASVGGATLGDGAAAWYWDVSNPDEKDEIWRAFGIGCVAIWLENQLLMLWGCAALQNPIGALFEHASTAFEGWDADAASLLPTIAQMPLGMVIVDEGTLIANVVS